MLCFMAAAEVYVVNTGFVPVLVARSQLQQCRNYFVLCTISFVSKSAPHEHHISHWTYNMHHRLLTREHVVYNWQRRDQEAWKLLDNRFMYSEKKPFFILLWRQERQRKKRMAWKIPSDHLIFSTDLYIYLPIFLRLNSCFVCFPLLIKKGSWFTFNIHSSKLIVSVIFVWLCMSAYVYVCT